MNLLELLDVNEDQVDIIASCEVSFTKIENSFYGSYYLMDGNKEIGSTEALIRELKNTDTVFIKKYDEEYYNNYEVEVYCENPNYGKTSVFPHYTYTVFVSENIIDLIKAVRYFNSVCKIKVQGLHF